MKPLAVLGVATAIIAADVTLWVGLIQLAPAFARALLGR